MRPILSTAACLCVLLLSLPTEARKPNKNASYKQLKLPATKVQILGKQHTVYWTTDDHPTGNTNAILDLLKKYNIRATFFVVSYNLYAYYHNPKWPVLISRKNAVQRMVREGHTIGNHSFTHGYLCRMSKKKVLHELTLTQKYIKRVTKITPKHWRPPHGSRCPQTRQAAKKLKLITAMWHIDDYKKSAAIIWWLIKRRVRRGYKETILLLHTNPKKTAKLIRFMKIPVRKAPLPRPSVLPTPTSPPKHRTNSISK